MRLLTRRLSLQPVSARDSRELAALDDDPEVMRFVSGGLPTGLRTIETWVIPRAQQQHREFGTGMWTMRDRAGGGFVGWTSLRTPRHSGGGELELSYRIGRPAWGLGLAAEASSALIAAVFSAPDCGVGRIFASTHPRHLASRRVMEKIGMRLTADSAALRPGPDWPADAPADLEYELLRDHWRRTGLGHTRRTATVGASGMPA